MTYSLQILEWIEEVAEEYREYKNAYAEAEDILKYDIVTPYTYLENGLEKFIYKISRNLSPYDYGVGLDVYTLKQIILDEEDYKFMPYVDKVLGNLRLIYEMSFKSIENKEYLQRTREDVMPLVNLYLLTKGLHILDFMVVSNDDEIMLSPLHKQGAIKIEIEKDVIIFKNGLI